MDSKKSIAEYALEIVFTFVPIERVSDQIISEKRWSLTD
jgi:hypothetical protein